MSGRSSLDSSRTLELVREYCATSLSATALEDRGILSFRVLEDLADLGTFALPFARECGGLGAGFEAFVSALEIVGSTSASYAACIAAHFSACWPIQQFGSTHQRTQVLPELLDGSDLAAWQVHTGNAQPRGALVSEGPYGFVVAGSVDWTLNAGHSRYVTMFASTAPPHLQQTCFLLDTSTSGLFVLPTPPTFGLRDARFAKLTLDSVELPLSSVIGAPGRGRAIALESRHYSQIAFAAILVGVAETALDEAIADLKRQPRREDLSAALPANVVRTQAAREAVRAAARRYDAGKPFAEPPSRTLERACTAAVEAAVTALDVLAPRSISGQTAVERLIRDALTLRALSA